MLKNRNITLNHGSALKREIIEFQSPDLIVTSPPYNVGIEYNSNTDSNDYKSYLEFSKQWIENCYFWAKDGARFCLNIPLDKNKGGQQSVGGRYYDFSYKHKAYNSISIHKPYACLIL